jgi:hypothetical protein
LGSALDAAKRTAPQRPHPRLADTPPENLVPTAVSGVIDKASELVHQARNS